MKTKKTKYQPIDTDIICPKCSTHIDVSGIKEAIKHRIDVELDSILGKI